MGGWQYSNAINTFYRSMTTDIILSRGVARFCGGLYRLELDKRNVPVGLRAARGYRGRARDTGSPGNISAITVVARFKGSG
jgi:hypothetical protein